MKTYIRQRLNPTWLKLRILRLIMSKINLLNTQTGSCAWEWKRMLRGDRMLFAWMLCLLKCHTTLKKNQKRILPKCWCFDCGDDAELSRRWYVRRYGLISNVMTASEYHTWKKYSVRVWWGVTWFKKMEPGGRN